MIIEKELKKLFHQLIHGADGHITLGGSDITVHMFEQASKFALSTSVYEGGNFIPKSVRTSLSHKGPFSPLRTTFNVDENNFLISLNYLGHTDSLTDNSFIELLEEFGDLADQWRTYLDEHGKNDLIHVRVK